MSGSKRAGVMILDKGGDMHLPSGRQFEVVCPAGTSLEQVMATANRAFAAAVVAEKRRKFIDRICSCGEAFTPADLLEENESREAGWLNLLGEAMPAQNLRRFIHAGCGQYVVAVWDRNHAGKRNEEFTASAEEILASRARSVLAEEEKLRLDDPDGIGEQALARN